MQRVRRRRAWGRHQQVSRPRPTCQSIQQRHLVCLYTPKGQVWGQPEPWDVQVCGGRRSKGEGAEQVRARGGADQGLGRQRSRNGRNQERGECGNLFLTAAQQQFFLSSSPFGPVPTSAGCPALRAACHVVNVGCGGRGGPRTRGV